MADDIRFSVNFWQHPKTIKLTRKGGLEAVRSLQILWCFCAQERTDGILSGMDVDDIEIAADWQGEPGRFVELLLAGSWLERLEGDTYALHGWEERQAYVSKKKLRQEQAKAAAETRWKEKRGAQPAVPDDAMSNADGMLPASETHANSNADSCEQHCPQHGAAMLDHAQRNAPIPDPIPDPDLNPTHPMDIFKYKDARVAKSVPEGGGGDGEEPVPPDENFDFGFAQAWDAYPAERRGPAADAVIAWKGLARARDLPGLPILLEAITKWEDSGQWRRENGRFIPHFANFLRRRMWEQEPPPDSAGAARPKSARDEQAETMDRWAREILEEERRQKEAEAV